MKTLVITGANRGIGLALCSQYLSQNWKVKALCRTSSTGLDSSGAEVITGIDVTNAECLKNLPELLQGQSIDLLINNAGILRSDQLEHFDTNEIVDQFMVNALAPLQVTHNLLGLMAPNSKIAFITSRMGSISDNTSGGYYGYRMSKAALNAAAMSLSRDLKPRGIAVGLLHPGYVQTAMVNFGGDISAEVAAERLAARIHDLNLENSGGFWHSNGERLPW